MGLINVISFSKPMENFASEYGKQLFTLADNIWREFLKKILELMEGEEIFDDDFIKICNLLARIHSAPQPEKHTEMLEAWSRLVELPLADIKAWEAGKNLPAIDQREEIVRQMLLQLVQYVRKMNAQVFLGTMIRLVELKDSRDSRSWVIVTPNTHRRGIHRLGLSKEVSFALFESNLKTLGDLKSFVEPPIPGGLIMHSNSGSRTPRRPSFNPKEKLQTLQGIDAAAADQILAVVSEWGSFLPPSRLHV